MISGYYRPKSITDALDLIGNGELPGVLVGGGTALQRSSPVPFVIVDLQDLPLAGVQPRGNLLEVGATTRLQALLEHLELPDSLHKAILHEATYNLRQVATIAGCLVSASGRSPLATALLSLDAEVHLRTSASPEPEKISLGDLLPLREERLKQRLITHLVIPTNLSLVYDSVSRTPADLPIVCCAVATWPSGRTRVALGGFGPSPLLAFDGPDSAGAELAAQEAFSQASDEWASAAYRQYVAGIMVRRSLAGI